MRGAAALAIVIAACQPPPPAQSPCPPQTVYVGAPAQQQPANPYDDADRQDVGRGTQAEIAARLDDEGDKLFDRGRFAEATSRFREAVARAPEAIYFFHLCRSLYQEGKFSEALTACDAGTRSNPASGLRTQIDTYTAKINSAARAQGVPLPRTDPRDPDPQPRSDGTQAAIAAKLDDEGVKLFTARRYAEASSKHREAVARVPEAKYFFHLCNSLFYEGKFSEAITACNAVGHNDPPPDIKQKTDALTRRILDEARAQGLNITPP